MKLRLLVAASCSLLLLAACQKEVENPADYDPEVPISPELLEHFNFGVGSTWVYENQDGERTTVELISAEEGQLWGCPMTSCNRNKYINQVYRSSMDGSTYNQWLILDRIRMRGSGNRGESGSYVYNLSLDPAGSENSEWLTDLEVGDHEYAEAQRVFTQPAPADRPYPLGVDVDTEFYWVKNVGMVLKVEQDPNLGQQTWELVEWNIVR